MRKRKKTLVNNLENRISELEQEINNLNREKKTKLDNETNIIYNAISLFAASEKLDFFLLNLDNHSITSLTPKQSVFFSHSDDELISFDSIIIEEDKPEYYYAINTLKEKPFTKVQTKIKIPSDISKDFRPVEVSLINLSGDTDKVLLVLKDISKKLKQKRALLKSKEKIEESDKLKSTILSNISHFIRTPLNSVTGFSELLATVDLENKKRQEYIDIIKRQSKRILCLIDDLSEMAKLESGNIKLSSNPCNLDLILNELLIGINQQRTEAQRELVNIKLDTPPGKGLKIITDSGRLQQILNNLINHSLRYTQKGNIQIGYRLDEAIQKVIFFIKDTSNGLTKDEQKNIFNKFSILDSSESNKYEDPGLGLTIAKILIKNLGGRIWVESIEGKGNEFFFTHPYEHITNEETISIEEEFTGEIQFQWPNKLILIVDDEEINAKFIDAVLQGTSVQVLFAKNGQEAVELCKSINKIDLILMDLKMPVMNGIKATSEIRKFNNTIPIIAQTALASEEVKQKSLQAGCSDITTKPIDVQELLHTVNKYLAD